MVNLKTPLLTAALALGLSAAAHAGDDAGWKLLDKVDGISPGPAIAAHDAEGNGVLLKCSEKSLTLGFTTEPRDIGDVLGKKAGRMKKREMAVTFADGSKEELDVLYLPFFKTVMSGDRGLATKVFSSAMNEEKLVVDVQRADPVEVQLPGRNDAFDAFVADCPLVK